MTDASGLRAAVRDTGLARFDLAVEEVIAGAGRKAPVKSGVLAQSVSEVSRDVTDRRLAVTIGTPVEYASYQNEGTGVYGPKGQPIRPVNSKVLVWEGPSGSLIFATQVKGSPATRWWDDTVNSGTWTAALTAST